MPGKAREIICAVCQSGCVKYGREGLSEATLEKFIAMGYIKEYADIFHLDRYREEIQSMEGFGEKSYQNLIDSIEKARVTTLPRVDLCAGNCEYRTGQCEDDLQRISK